MQHKDTSAVVQAENKHQEQEFFYPKSVFVNQEETRALVENFMSETMAVQSCRK